MIQIYRFFYIFAKTILVTLAPFLNPKTKKWIQLRAEIHTSKHQNLQLKNSVWIHASSGEIEYAKPLIREIKNQNPSLQIVVTYSSDSAEKLFENIRSLVDLFIPIPWDDTYSIRTLIKKLNPKIIIIARTDLWPEMIYQGAQNKIPLILISYFFNATSFRSIFLKPLLNKMNLISCVDDETKSQIVKLIPNSKIFLTTDGDTRFDQVFARLDQPSKIFINTKNKVFTFGSIWPEDEIQIFPLILEILKNNQNIILSPHDISEKNINRLYQYLEEKKITYKKLSEITGEIQFDSHVLIIDQIGYLADAYRFSDFAFVGGSFKSKVHSVMEPLCCGLPVFVGPFFQNNPEAVKYSSKSFQKFVFINKNSNDLIENYNKFNQIDLATFKQQINKEMQRNKGASIKMTQFILHNFLKK